MTAIRTRTPAALPPTGSLADWLRGSPFVGYSYAYPHKTAYRAFDPPLPLRNVWRGEDQQALFLYLHVPFCEVRCAFCNLFALSRPAAPAVDAWLDAMQRQAAAVRAALDDDARFVRLAIGGGTPTFLGADGLARLFDIANTMGLDARAVPSSVEASPDTLDAGICDVLRDHRVARLSMGVQSFDAGELRRVGRALTTDRIETAIDQVRAAAIPVLNLDLICGLPGQTLDSFAASLAECIRHQPEEVFVYPLYSRPLTGLDRGAASGSDDTDIRPAAMALARGTLIAAGYRQVTLRCFRRTDVPDADGPAYCCQTDGMVGLGIGARSYTRELHYSSEYAVGRASVREMIAGWAARSTDEFAHTTVGIRLHPDDERRRFVIQSLLHESGLSFAHYGSRFAGDPREDLPQLAELATHGMATADDHGMRLTADGLAWSDVIGPWLYSSRVRELMESYEWA